MKNLEIKSFLDYKFLSNLDFNEDGSFLAFTLTKADLEENKYDSSIYVLNTEDKKYKKLTHSTKEKNSLWLDENRILFSADRDEKIQGKIKDGENWTSFYCLDLKEGGEAYKYMDIPLNVTGIKKIDENNFILTAIFDNNSLNINNLKGEEREKAIKEFTENKDYEIIDEIPFWSNGSGFINKKRNSLYLFNKAENSFISLTDEFTNVELFNVKDEKVVFIAESHRDKLEMTNGLFTYDIKNKKIETIIEDKEYNFSYANFIDNKIVCALSDMKAFGINENHKLYLVEDNKLNLFYNNDSWLISTVGSDSRLGGGKNIKIVNNKIYFISTENDSSFLYSIDLNSNVEKLTEADGSVDCFDVSGDKVYYIGMRNYGLQEIYQIENNNSSKITDLNDEIFKNFKISKPEKITFETNGDVTEGFIIKPVDYDENKTYPAILDIHGGPKTVYGNVFYHEMQVWANMGYFVFFCNPHGSDGKGDNFADIRGKYGTIDYEDIMNWCDIVLEKYPIDKERLGVTGGSYGGYMTNWIIGHTDRFKCAASQRSISNWISKFGTTDIGYYFNADQNASTPWENHDKLWWHSPLKYADKVKTPTLFIHSEEDYRCWIAEGLQMFTALKYHGVDSRLCMFK